VGERISTLITDLDNTLWDWVHTWHAWFSTLTDVLVAKGGLNRDTLLDEARAIHQRVGTSEYSLLLKELPSLAVRGSDDDVNALVSDAAEAANEARRHALVLYPGVEHTLEEIKQSGALIVGYTESMAFHTAQRLRATGMDGFLVYLYSSPDHDFPGDESRKSLRRHPDDYYELKKTQHRNVERGRIKPDAAILRQIVSEVGAETATTAYVGDSLMKDISMAQDAGVIDVLAAYGAAQHLEEYELLRRVTHWSDEHVELEKAMIEEQARTPTYTLENSFEEVLELFTFVPLQGGSGG
jgi:phosphoglycolate phosphatase-like HAD superfamily hydrolase